MRRTLTLTAALLLVGAADAHAQRSAPRSPSRFRDTFGIPPWLGIALIALIALWIVLMTIPSTRARILGGARGLARRLRGWRGRRSAAAVDDPRLAPERVRRDAAELFRRVKAAWHDGDRDALGELLAPELAERWGHWIDHYARKGERQRALLLDEPQVEYLGVRDGRARVRIECTLDDRLEPAPEGIRRTEQWTLAPEGPDGWRVVAIERKDPVGVSPAS